MYSLHNNIAVLISVICLRGSDLNMLSTNACYVNQDVSIFLAYTDSEEMVACLFFSEFFVGRDLRGEESGDIVMGGHVVLTSSVLHSLHGRTSTSPAWSQMNIPCLFIHSGGSQATQQTREANPFQ